MMFMHCFYIIVHSVHVRCLIKCLLGIFSLDWTPMSTKLWGFSCFLIRNMFGLLVVYLRHLAPHMHFPCFGHALHVATSCTLCYPCHALVYTLFLHPRMSYLPYALQHFFLSFFFLASFLIHLAPPMHHSPCSYLHLLPSFLLDPFVYSC